MIAVADVMILDKNFANVAVLDVYESFIWTDRYNKAGDFEVYTIPTQKYLDGFQMDYYLWKSDSEHVMIVEHKEITTDVEEGARLIVKGRSLESILDRRIVWKTITLNGKIQSQIKKLLDENVINPEDPNRKIANFIFEENNDPRLDAITVEAQYTGTNIANLLNELCEAKKIGWKITLNTQNKFVFKLYVGEDRSYAQDKNPYVVFSPSFDNIIDSDYMEYQNDYKSVALVAGEGEEEQRRKLEVFAGTKGESLTGLYRRELYVDARDISSRDETSNDYNATISEEAYNKLLATRGGEKLEEYKIVKLFQGEADTFQIYRYNEHFGMGDICELENEYGMETQVRIVEFIHSETPSDGVKAYPTFEVVEEEEEGI